ncbi:hypothetical protein ROHU_015303 [Labeo rohita]|uniref:Uncharacterized protein n=1 Tax=Labeo rohita TaxID=84645 RepID=A0A498NQM7_LABRO|nr:hypothetical protein ROHU_015303 [Labeo rohita]
MAMDETMEDPVVMVEPVEMKTTSVDPVEQEAMAETRNQEMVEWAWTASVAISVGVDRLHSHDFTGVDSLCGREQAGSIESSRMTSIAMEL